MNFEDIPKLGLQIPIDFANPPDNLPPQEQFPLTVKGHGRRVKDIVLKDIAASAECLIITGFTSLAQIIDAFSTDENAGKKVRILLGVEPQIKTRKKWKQASLSQEIQDYWLEKGISPFQCGAVLQLIERIASGQVQIKAMDKLHAKLYVTERAAILGSSNFSFSGLTVQHEANIRFQKDRDENNGLQYESIKNIAEYYWQRGRNFSNELIALLQELLVIVDWQEALARAVADLLEGKYIKEYLKNFEQAGVPKLWPSQASGIHQGLQILQQLGSLLVADPTGSGKTKMVCTLQVAMLNWLWETGRGAKTNTVVVAPPLVLESWKKEHLALQRTLPDPISQGILSMPHSYKHALAKDALKIANVLVMDEAHNYLNEASKRSSAISVHGAEFIILSTATPINKRAEDLLRLVQLLDPDNLGDKELQEFKELYKAPAKALEENPQLLKQLRSYIWKFTLRRTKDDINRLIKKDPHHYLNRLGIECHYPEQRFEFYPTGESEKDIQKAIEIERLTEGLKGLIYLRTIKFPRRRDLSDAEKRRSYINGRMGAAKALSRYRVQATLRSSKLAAIELVEGTEIACKWGGLPPISKETGNILQTIADMKEELPQYPQEWDVLPDWLTNKEAFQKACDEEIAIYTKISQLVKTISDNRENTKALQLIQIMRKHSLVVSFDHTVITLYYLHKLIGAHSVQSYVVTGGNKNAKQIILDHFSLSSTSRNIIILCSDAISEGVNLQAAPAVVILDMPSVLRLAEQRIGRIDRLDSPHSAIHIYFPIDSDAFCLRADRNLIRTSHLNKQLMGSNLNLPDEMMHRYEDLKHMSAQDVVEEIKINRHELEQEWEGIKDAFGEVVRLIEGDDPLLTEEEYQRMIHSKATVRCKLSFVASKQSWAFISLRGTGSYASSWLFITEDEQVVTEYSGICHLLRQNLINTDKQPFSQKELDHFIQVYRKKQRETLPNKKRRALHVAEEILKRQHKFEKKKNDAVMVKCIEEVLLLFRYSHEDVSVDYHAFAMIWLDILTPKLKRWRAKVQTRRFLSLEDLSKYYKHHFFTQSELNHVIQNVALTEPLELQIASCIIGVKAC